MNYTLHQLRIFLKVAETGSVTRAAEALHLTQPAVSIQLKKLQDQFEIPLTEIVGRRLYITDFGKKVVEAGTRILEEVHSIRYMTEAYLGHLTGQLRVAVVSTGKYVMPYFLAEFLRQHPGIDLIMDVTNKARVVRSLEKNEVDFALVSVLPEKPEVKKISLMRNKLFLIGAKHPGKKGEGITADRLAELPLIFREEGSATRMAMENYIGSRKIAVKKTLTLTSNEAVKQALIAGLGYSIMPVIGLRNELQNGDLSIFPMDGLPVITNWNLIWLRQKNFSPAAKAYLEHLQAHKARIIDEQFEWFEQI